MSNGLKMVNTQLSQCNQYNIINYYEKNDQCPQGSSEIKKIGYVIEG